MRAALATFAQGTSFGTTANVWNFYAEGSGQIDLIILLLHENLANLFRHRVFPGSPRSLLNFVKRSLP